MISVTNLGSGSKGNSTFVDVDGVGVLIDIGFTNVNLRKRLAIIGKSYDDVEVVFITHEHGDHLNQRNYDILTSKGINIIKLWEQQQEIKSPFDWKAYKMNHDVPCYGISITDMSGNKMALITDTFDVPCESLPILLDVNILMVEANYDITIMEQCEYPDRQKIRSMETHMENSTAKDVVSLAWHNKLYYVIGLHKSAVANEEVLMLQSLEHGLPDGSNTIVVVAKQKEHIKTLTVY